MQENCFIARREGATEAIVVDPGDEAPRLLEAIGSSASTSRRSCSRTPTSTTSAPWRRWPAPPVRPSGARSSSARCSPTSWTTCRGPGFGPFESYEADHLVAGGERLQLAGLDIDVLFTPGHSPGHVAYSIPAAQIVFSGDVLFQGSIGRTDLPGGDHATLLRSIATLLETLPGETRVAPGHMGPTTLERERATNPFLQELV